VLSHKMAALQLVTESSGGGVCSEYLHDVNLKEYTDQEPAEQETGGDIPDGERADVSQRYDRKVSSHYFSIYLL